MVLNKTPGSKRKKALLYLSDIPCSTLLELSLYVCKMYFYDLLEAPGIVGAPSAVTLTNYAFCYTSYLGCPYGSYNIHYISINSTNASVCTLVLLEVGTKFLCIIRPASENKNLSTF